MNNELGAVPGASPFATPVVSTVTVEAGAGTIEVDSACIGMIRRIEIEAVVTRADGTVEEPIVLVTDYDALRAAASVQ